MLTLLLLFYLSYIFTLGLITAAEHIRQGREEGNAFRWIQGISEVILAVLAILGIRSGIRALRGRPAGGVAPVEAAAPAENDSEMPAAEEKAEDEMPAVGESADTAASDGVIVFTIVQAESEVRFTLGELLSGIPTTVIGATDQIAGEIAIDPADPASSKVGVILVNARTFVTDNDFRNRAINNSILETGRYEFITFTPTEVIGFPADPALGEALDFQIHGELTVRDITNPITFDVTVTAVSETRLEGSASTMLTRADYNLQIPEVSRVADVDEDPNYEDEDVSAVKSIFKTLVNSLL